MFKGLFGGRSHRKYALGIDHFNAGRMVEAIAAFDDALETDSDGPDAALARFYRAEAHAHRGAAHLEADEPDLALSHIEAALEEHGHYPDLQVQRALALLGAGDPLEAADAARQALALNPDFVDAGATLAIALRARGDAAGADEAARQWAERAAGLGHPLAIALAGGADLLGQLSAHRRRRRERRRAVAHAESCLRDGFWSEAARDLAPLVDETPDYPDLRLRLAAAQLGLDDLPAARAQLDAALRINPRFADAHVLAGIVRLRLDEVASARGHFEAGERIGRVPLVAAYGLMLCELRCGNLEAALGRMNRLAGEEGLPDDARVLHAILEGLAGRTSTALERFDALLADLRRTDLLLDVVVWAIGDSRLEFAHRALERIDEEDRTRPDVVHAHARTRAREGALDRARGLLESALLNHPSDPELLLELARLLARIGDAEAGLRCLATLDAAGVDAAGLRGLRAKLLRRGGRSAEAAAHLDAVTPADDAAAALERLYLLRAADAGVRAREVHRRWSDRLDLTWRVQDPGRWLRPLRPWPAEVLPPQPTA